MQKCVEGLYLHAPIEIGSTRYGVCGKLSTAFYHGHTTHRRMQPTNRGKTNKLDERIRGDRPSQFTIRHHQIRACVISARTIPRGLTHIFSFPFYFVSLPPPNDFSSGIFLPPLGITRHITSGNCNKNSSQISRFAKLGRLFSLH